MAAWKSLDKKPLKEKAMHYKTMVLEMLEDRPRLKERLQRERQLLLTMERYAEELKLGHEAWKTRLSHAQPYSSPLQIASGALELALHDLAARLPSESPAEDQRHASAATATSRLPSSDD
jgi:hypothetical protein